MAMPRSPRGRWRGVGTAAVLAAVAALWLTVGADAAPTGTKILIPHPDGSRNPPTHRIQLYDRYFTGGEYKEKVIHVQAKKGVAEPFNLRATCDKCHELDHVEQGWHFNASNPKVDPGRPGEPWIFVDRQTGTQIPLSMRAWKGTYTPADLLMANWRFVQRFGRQMPGGGLGESKPQAAEDDRFMDSGPLPINCLGCHNASGRQDQSAWAVNVGNGNFKWAATAASHLALVTGDVSSFPAGADVETTDPDHPDRVPMETKYFTSMFDGKDFTILDLTARPDPKRCYYCHSTTWQPAKVDKADEADHEPQIWRNDRDVHLSSGLICTDCHRNGEKHHISRGYEGEVNPAGSSVTLTCRGCHLGTGATAGQELPGRLGAPRPKHAGIPPVHLEKLSCTTCHSGPWPRNEVGLVRTSRAHGLGVHGKSTRDPLLPYVVSPVFAKGQDGRIAPHHAIWPAFWARHKGDLVAPQPIADVIALGEDLLPTLPKGPPTEDNYTPPTPEAVAKTLEKVQGNLNDWAKDTPRIDTDADAFAKAAAELADKLLAAAAEDEPVKAIGKLLGQFGDVRDSAPDLADLAEADGRSGQLVAAAMTEWAKLKPAEAAFAKAIEPVKVKKPGGKEEATTRPAVDVRAGVEKAAAAYRAVVQAFVAKAKAAADDRLGWTACYISNGKLYEVGKDGKLAGIEHAAAKPYLWPVAHDVRPANQALGYGGAAGCQHCHAPDSPIFFAKAIPASPAPMEKAKPVAMYELLGEDGTYWKNFARSFVFRPMLKIVGLASAAIIAAVVLLYAFLGLRAMLAAIAARSDKS